MVCQRSPSISNWTASKTLTNPQQQFPPPAAAKQLAEKLLSFVGRAFRHDIKTAFSSGVLTPEGPKPHFSATCLADEAN